MALTVTQDLLDGVGEFVKVGEYELKSLLNQEDLDKGLDETALDPYHDSVWEACKNWFKAKDNELPEVENMSDDLQTTLKAACCYEIMSVLYRRNASGNKESHAWSQAEWYDGQFEKVVSSVKFLKSDGTTTRLGVGLNIYRY